MVAQLTLGEFVLSRAPRIAWAFFRVSKFLKGDFHD